MPTDREREMLALMVTGLCNEDTARLLMVSAHTAKTHLNRGE
jgi:DNA-binding CsgD family transcriptional regulator